MKKHVVVIGGGMAGTAAAHTLLKLGHRVIIIEKNDYIGGRIRTQVVDGAVVEMGAAFMTKLYTNVHTFLQESGLVNQLYRQRIRNGILRNNRVRMATVKTLLGSSALSWRAKIRVARLVLETIPHWGHLDHHAFWKGAKHDDRTVSDVFKELDKEVLEYVLQPILGGYFYWDPKQVSYEMLLGLCKAALIQGGMCNLRDGLKRIPENAAKGSDVLLNTAVQEVKRSSDGSFKVTTRSNGKIQTINADGIVCATTATVVPKMFKNLTDTQKSFFQSINYSSTVAVGQVFRADDINTDQAIAFPRKEQLEVSAITSTSSAKSSSKLADVKIYASGAAGDRLCSKSDEDIINDLSEGVGSTNDAIFLTMPKPLKTYVQRWQEALPLFDVGHLKRLQDFEEGLIENSSEALVFAGDYIGGPFIEGAFTSGRDAATRLDEYLKTI